MSAPHGTRRILAALPREQARYPKQLRSSDDSCQHDLHFRLFAWSVSAPRCTPVLRRPSEGAYSSLVASHAAAHGLPPSLVHRVIMRESRYNPRAVSKGNYGMMQIRLGTARAMGYRGSAAGLLDPNTNMTYAVKYLAGAYRAAGGNPDRAVSLYASGYGGRAAPGLVRSSRRLCL